MRSIRQPARLSSAMAELMSLSGCRSGSDNTGTMILALDQIYTKSCYVTSERAVLFRCHHEGMTSIQVKNVPSDVHQTLREQAVGAGQSLQEYLLEFVSAWRRLSTRVVSWNVATHDASAPACGSERQVQST